MFVEDCVMKKVLIILCILLAGCARDTTITDDVFNGIHNDINDLVQQLPTECKNAATNSKIKSLTDRVELAQKSCNKDISDCRAEVRRWRFRFYGLVAAVITAIVLLLYKKVRKIF